MSELNINRRAFLAGTAVVAGGLVLGVFPAQRAAAMPNARAGSFSRTRGRRSLRRTK
jgi:hypothetical protein